MKFLDRFLNSHNDDALEAAAFYTRVQGSIEHGDTVGFNIAMHCMGTSITEEALCDMVRGRFPNATIAKNTVENERRGRVYVTLAGPEAEQFATEHADYKERIGRGR